MEINKVSVCARVRVYLHVGHLALQAYSGLLCYGELLLVPTAQLLQRLHLRLRGLQPRVQSGAFSFHLLQLCV